VHRRPLRSRGYWRALALAAVVVCATGSGTAAPEEAPLPPCIGVSHPASPDPGAPPQVQVWNSGELATPWCPPPCTGWTTRDFKMLIALAGSFPHDGNAEALLARFGAFSALTEIRYWSVSDSAWRPLVTDATALSAPDPDRRRADFTAAEMAGGEDLFFAQSDNRSSKEVVYRLRVLEMRPGRLVIQTENVSAVRLLLLTLFGPGDIQVAYFLQRRSPGVWDYYSLTRTNPRFGGHVASYINRAVAAYRHIAGIPTDRDPPLVP
jgi:uncharacterized protein DUF6675